MATTPPAAYVFDAYGTLFDVHSVARACDACWPGRGAALSQLWRSKQLEYTWLRSLMGRYAPFSAVTRDALQWSCESLGLPLKDELDGLMAEYLRLKTYDDVPATLRRLEGKKAILSNGSPDMLDPLVRSSGLQFDAVLSVDPLRVYKPAPQVYELASSRLALPRERIAFISSNCWDAIGARAFGFRVYWINRAKAPVDRLGFAPDRVLTTLSDLS
ncbi:MAG TPA: haloacid dehalogenase type II [Burkholderiales bacterium]|nr:haloacid dehalogenase type II [Burkholderiales bacterium]